MSIGALILSGGKSSRFGSPKALALFSGRPFAERIALAAQEAGLFPRVLVLGYEAEKIAGTLRDLPVEIVVNKEFEAGQFSSLQAGVAALQGRCEGAVVCLVDQPHVQSAELETIALVLQGDTRRLVAPTVGGRGVHPVGIGAAWFEAILDLPSTFTLRDFFRDHREVVMRPELGNPLLLRDVDTPEDLRELERLTAESGRGRKPAL